MAKTVRLADIGERLGVSTVTVSKALSGQTGVSEELREKIIRLADEMGYRKSTAEAKQTGKESFTIGVIAAERYLQENQSFYWLLYQEISKKAIEQNCFPMLEVISPEKEDAGGFPKVVTEGKADGLIILGAFKGGYANRLIESKKLPMVNLDTTNGWEMCDCVVSNNFMGGCRMTDYLFELGHEKIGFVGTRRSTSSIDDRYSGYLKSLMEHGAEWKEDWVIDDRSPDSGRIYKSDELILPKEDMPTAFFCNCDLSAGLLIARLEKAGYGVPGDVSVAGFDNYMSGQSAGIGITTYETGAKEMAERAVHSMLQKCRNASYTSGTSGIFMLAGRFIERESARRIGPPVRSL